MKPNWPRFDVVDRCDVVGNLSAKAVTRRQALKIQKKVKRIDGVCSIYPSRPVKIWTSPTIDLGFPPAFAATKI